MDFDPSKGYPSGSTNDEDEDEWSQYAEGSWTTGGDITDWTT